jgi:pyruvate kinase
MKFKNNFTKTKILATIGPATDSVEMLSKLVDAGANAFRLNFSHGSYDYFEKVIKNIIEVSNRKSLPISIHVDLQGPKIRIGELSEKEIEINTGQTIEITVDDVIGTKEKISTSYKSLVRDASLGETILIDDGLIELKIIEKKEKSVICKVIDGGLLKPRKGMNLPDMKLSTPSITEKDKRDLEFILKHQVDFIALSFVRSPSDITELREWIKARGFNKPLIAKIEKKEGVDNFDEILEVADGIMVARGDLGVELQPQEVPVIQKEIIRRCNALGKLVITATQMLESMINNPIPTRAEASDIANAVWDGTDVVMLSAETSVGNFPVEAVEMMKEILIRTEEKSKFQTVINYEVPKNLADNLFDSTGKGTVDISNQVNASAAVIFTHYGRKAKVVSKFRPNAPVFAISDKLHTLNMLNLYHNIIPVYLDDIVNEELAVDKARIKLEKYVDFDKGDIIIFAAGAPISEKGRRSWLRFVII